MVLEGKQADREMENNSTCSYHVLTPIAPLFVRLFAPAANT